MGAISGIHLVKTELRQGGQCTKVLSTQQGVPAWIRAGLGDPTLAPRPDVAVRNAD
jgi:hypothetical protein